LDPEFEEKSIEISNCYLSALEGATQGAKQKRPCSRKVNATFRPQLDDMKQNLDAIDTLSTSFQAFRSFVQQSRVNPAPNRYGASAVEIS
jgi:hypothetical protein